MIAGKTRWALVGLAALLALAPSSASATPEAATWHRASLIGENAEHYFRWMAERSQPGSYYTYTETLRFQKVRKSDLAVVEDVLVREVVFSQHPDTMVWVATEESPPAFDLGGRLGRDGVQMTFEDDGAPVLVLDDSGAWVEAEGERERVLDRAELLRQIPGLGEQPRTAGAGSAASSSTATILYYRVLSGTAAFDSDWSEDLLLVPESAIRAAYARLDERLPAPKR
jgi:hypothetical protein